MREILYIEIPTPDTTSVRRWLQTEFNYPTTAKQITSVGIRLKVPSATEKVAPIPESQTLPPSLTIFVWSV
ncbi:MAG: hypothetical protein H0X31_18550, partial [Nostocaceae cyanobacterium]|nr:hypothetical protein [Nostocaceae cyanobacterium]